MIALDLDGTLLNMEKKVSQGNYEALKQCETAGIQIVPATGRGVGGIPPMIRELPGANYAITTNGAVIADLKTNKAIRTCGLSNEMVQRILNIAKKYHSATDRFSLTEGPLPSLLPLIIWMNLVSVHRCRN
ncbi:MAG: HAD family hydrolase [Blautia massiliensis (ex Durand et al. 2017)]